MYKIKLSVGDTVMVRKGSQKGKTGKIIAVHPSTNKVTVEGLNKVKRHRKPSQSLPQGGVFEETMPLPVANVGIVHPSKKNQTSRIGFTVDKSGKKKRIYKANGKEIS